MAESNPKNIYFTAPFACNGELVGVGAADVTMMSPRWLDACEQMLHRHGSSFRASFGDTLQHLEVKLTSGSGAGLGTFFAHGRVVASTAYLCGRDLEAEREVLKMFADSLRNIVAPPGKAAEQQFARMTTITQRPLHIVVPWGDPDVSEQDQELVRELANHFAAAYLCRYEG